MFTDVHGTAPRAYRRPDVRKGYMANAVECLRSWVYGSTRRAFQKQPTTGVESEMYVTKKHAFMLVAGSITSMVVPIDTVPEAFQMGSLQVLQQALDLGVLGILPAGWLFQVVEHDHATGLVGLRAVQPHMALSMWDQLLILQPFCTEDALECFNVPIGEGLTRNSVAA